METRAARFGIAAALVAVVLATAPAAPDIAAVGAANQCEWDHIEHVVAVGDVHGAYDQYLEILKTAGIVDAGEHWSAGTTHFVQLGDIVDRGADGRKALDFNRRLAREAEKAGGVVH